MKSFLIKYRENKFRAWASFGYLFFALSCFRLTVRYVFDEKAGLLPQGLNWLSTPYGSIVFWGILWGLASVLGAYAAIQNFLTGESKLIFFSIVTYIALHIIWGASYIAGWLFFNGTYEWFNAFGYIGFIGLLIGYGSGALGALRGKKPFNKNTTQN